MTSVLAETEAGWLAGNKGGQADKIKAKQTDGFDFWSLLFAEPC